MKKIKLLRRKEPKQVKKEVEKEDDEDSADING